MSWRIVVISHRAKLDFKLGSLIVRGDTVTKIHLSEISMLVIENTGVSLTAYLMSELIKSKVKVIFCDEKRNPVAEMVPYYGSHDTSAKLRQQIKWDDYTKGTIWTEIVTEKIRQQRNVLRILGKNEFKLLNQYLKEITFFDETNREGHAAKVYFNALFGMKFSRSLDHPINAALNYGYSIILAAVNREIVKNGYITQLGLFHDNMFNQFNLGSDLMEPFRPIIDYKVLNMEFDEFDHKEKMELLDVLNSQVIMDGKKQYLNNAIGLYVRSIFDALNDKDPALISFYQNVI